MLPPLIVLTGACLVAWGAHAPLVNLPVLGDMCLFDLGHASAWTLCIMAALAVPLVWLRQRALALTAVVAAVVALTFSLHALGSRLTGMKTAGTITDVEKVLRDSHARAGAAYLGGGLLLQLLGIMFRSQPAANKD